MTFNTHFFSDIQAPSCRFGDDQVGQPNYQFPPITEAVSLETICSQLTPDPAHNIALLFHYGPAYLGCKKLSYGPASSSSAASEEEHHILLSLEEQCCVLNLEGLTAATSDAKKKAFATLLLQQERGVRRANEYQNDQKYSQCLFDNCPDGLVVFNSKGVIIDTNRTFVHMCGVPKSELIGTKGHILMATRYQNAAAEVIERTVLKGSSRFKGRLKSTGGSELPVRATIQTFRYQGETLLFSVVREFSNLDEKVWRFEQYTRSLAHSFQQADDAYLTCSDSGEILESNPAFFHIFGLSSADPGSHLLHEFVSRNSLSIFRKSLAAVAATGHASFSSYLEHTDGTSFPARVSLLRFQREERQAYRCIIQRTDRWALPEKGEAAVG